MEKDKILVRKKRRKDKILVRIFLKIFKTSLRTSPQKSDKISPC